MSELQQLLEYYPKNLVSLQIQIEDNNKHIAIVELKRQIEIKEHLFRAAQLSGEFYTKQQFEIELGELNNKLMSYFKQELTGESLRK